jgi:putative transcriptional regulator
MAQENEPSFAELLLQGAREAAAHARGDPDMLKRARVTRRPLTARHVRIRAPGPPSPSRIREIREGLDVSQSVFADLLNVSPSTVRAWEQGKRTPHGPSLRLLEIAEDHPDALLGTADAVRR